MNSLVEELLGSLQEGTGDNDDGCGSISSLNILSLGDLDKHLSSWMNDGHFVQNSGAIIGDDNLTSLVLDLHIEIQIKQLVGVILTILSIPLGPRDVLTTSATALAAVILVCLISFDFSLSICLSCCIFQIFCFKIIYKRWLINLKFNKGRNNKINWKS